MDFEHPGIGEDIGEGDRRDGLDRTGFDDFDDG